MDFGSLLSRGIGKLRREILAERISQAHMPHDAFAEERAGTLRGPVDKLIGHDNVAGRNLFAQAAHRAHRDDPLDAEFFHSKDVGAGIHFGRQPTMALAVAGQTEESHSTQDASDPSIRTLADRRRYL